ncbi:MAG: PEP-CTERM system histidine kinase PrsK [Motiliproteus sp.]|nr:PEP-CTERM system histidine kinase PrsK [Motiliproteus sp.]MCW9053304.1 PEP-CTERM system histidine kinase PrsK [Motiliproteus sp.]
MGHFVGFISSSIVLLMLLFLVLYVWRGRFQGLWIIQAILFSFLWSSYIGISSLYPELNPTNQVFVEILRAVGWALLLWRLYALQRGSIENYFWKNKLLWGYGAAVLFLLIINVLQSTPVKLFESESNLFLSLFVLVVVVLVLLEQWYRNIKRENRWKIKFFALSLLIIFGYDFVLFSEALLYGRLDPTLWLARGWVTAVMAPFMVVSIARTDEWEQQVRVSHKAAFYSTGVLLAGVYLLIMSAVGYYLRWFGGGWGGAVQIVFVVLSLSFLGIVVASGTARGMISVWISKHFFTYKYDYRDEWLRANSRFAALPIDKGFFDELVKSIASPIDSMGGWLWIIEGDKLNYKAGWSTDYQLDLSENNTGSLVQFCSNLPWVIEVQEYQKYSHRYPGLELPEAMVSAEDLWLIVPLIHQSELFGFVGLRKPRADRSINWEDYDLLKALGGQLATLIALRKASEALGEARQFEAFNRLSAFVVHDLKNIVAQLSLVVTNAERHRNNPEFIDDALDTLSNAVGRMNRLLGQLRQQSQINVRSVVVSASDLLQDVVKNQQEQSPQVTIDLPKNDVRLRIEKERFTSVLCHLVQNAQEATTDDGTVHMYVLESNDLVTFVIHDTGCGMDQEFVQNRLFKPFDTTKGSAGMGIGVYEAQQFIKENAGRIDVESTPGKGTIFRLFLPRFL